MILAIDTSGQDLSLALTAPDGACIASYQDQLGRGHGERILPALAGVLAEAGKTYNDVQLLAVSTGPGSFTGLRVGLSVARGLALGRAVPCVGVSVLQILAAEGQAHRAAQSLEQHQALAGVIHVALETRGDDVFYQAFESVLAAEAVQAHANSILASVCRLPLPLPLGEAQSIAHTAASERAAAQPGLRLGALAETPHSVSGHTLAQLLGALVAGLGVRTAGGTTSMRADAYAAVSAAYPPEPLYIRAADAAPARILLPVEGVFTP